MDFKCLLLMLFVLFLSMSIVSANEMEDINVTSVSDESPIEIVDDRDNVNDDINFEESDVLQVSSDYLIQSDDDVIVVNNWEELQYYCAQTDKNYNIKLKENTNFYPIDPTSSSYQIKIKNNVKIIGSEGSWIGDSSNEPRALMYIGIVVEEGVRASLTLEDITFKWIKVAGGFNLPDGRFIMIAGKKNSIIKNCRFYENIVTQGHSCILHLQHSTATLDNCSFINNTAGYGCISVFTRSGETPHMTVQNCYFEGNYATTEPGCINNCAKLTVYNTTFVKNRSFWWAGAIHTHSGGSSTIYDSYFIDNVAGWNGGALYTYGNLKVYNSIFRGNNCTTDNGGGAIGACEYGSQPHIYIEGCLFEDNINNCWAPDSLSDGPGRGGAISIMDAGSLEVRETTFISNAAAQGTAICALAVQGYGTPDVILVNNSFINHTRSGDVLNIRLWDDSIKNITDNYYLGNSIVFSNLTLTKLNEDKEQALFEITASLSHPGWYDEDILDKTLYDVYINDRYVKTVNTTIFTIDFDDLDICDVYVVPTISNRKSNVVTATSTREYIFVSKSEGNDSNDGISRDSPVSTIKKALQLAGNYQNIILLDGDYSEGGILIDYDVCIKGEGNATLTGSASFISSSNFILKNLKISGLNTNAFIKQNANTLVISNCIFTNNNAVLVQNNGFTSLTNSILVNNSKIIDGDINKCVLDYNWWGSSLPDLNINKYATLNITSNLDALENNQKANVKAVFYLNDGSKYGKLPDINLDVTTLNGVASQNTVNIGSDITYTLTAFSEGALTVSYNNVNVSKTFEFLKSDPDISLTAEDIMFGEELTVTVTAPGDAEGNLTFNVGNLSQTEAIQSSKFVFTFENLKADTYTITLTYSGDKKYLSKELTSTVNVNRYESTVQLNLSDVNVGQDVIITVTSIATSTGNVTLSINNNTQTLTLNNSKANYTIKNIKRGDYFIKAIYNGDDKYLTSQDSKFIEVDNLNATMSIKASDITYGDLAVIKVTLNGDATGNVIVTIDGVSNQSKLSNGETEVTFTNLEAGSNKNITVFYSGDDTYFNLTKSSTFNIAKADLTFAISSSDIRIGQFAEIVITVPQRTSGTFTIGEDVINIPLSGEVSYIIPDLEIGNYTYAATYNGNNYYTVSKTTSFTVNEYPIPQVQNEGFNTQNTHKSQYESLINGNIAFTIPFNETLSGDLIIDSLGNVYLPTQNGIYAFNQTSQLWHFTSNTALGNLSGIAIGRDVIIAPKSGDTLYFINQTTGEMYGGSNIYQGSSLFSPIVDANATLYISSEYQTTSEDYRLTIIPYKLWENGGDPTLISIGNTQPLCAPTLNENIIVVVSDNRLRIIDAKTLQTLVIKSGSYMPIRPIIGEGNIVYAVLNDGIVAYNGNGVQIWKKTVSGGVGNILALDNNQGLYHVNARGIIYKYDLVDGSPSRFSSLKVTSGILIDANSNLYFGSNSIFYALGSDGNILWKSDLGSKVIGNPVMDGNGLIYVQTENGIVALTYAPLKDSDFKIQVDDIVEGQKATVTITWDSQATGIVTCNVNGEVVTADAGDLKITKVISGLGIGVYDVDVSYSGDMRFKATFLSKNFTVRSGGDVANNIQFDGNSTFTFSLSDAQGNLTVVIKNKTYQEKLVGGFASITITDLNPGEYDALVKYSGDAKYLAANRTFTMTVPKIDIDFNVSVVTENVLATVSISLPGDAGGNLTVGIGTRRYAGKVTGGHAEIVIDDLAEGNYTAVITYSGDDKYLSASNSTKFSLSRIPVTFNSSNLEIISPSSTPCVSVNFDGQITGDITVIVDGKTFSGTLANGKATIPLNDFDPGNYTGSISYSGNRNYSSATADISFEIPKIVLELNATTLSWSVGIDNATFTVNLASDARGRLTVGYDDKEKSGSVVNGVSTVVLTGLNPGNYEVNVTYSGDDKYEQLSKRVRFTISKITVELNESTLSVDSSNVPTVNVILNSDASGELSVYVNRYYKANVVNGTASVIIDDLAPGKYDATVYYSGDGKYASANRTVEIEVSKFNLDLDLKSAGNVVNVVILRNATGSVTVTVGGKTYVEILVDGRTSIALDGLSPGSYNASVRYSGDDIYLPANGIVGVAIPKISVVFDESNLIVNQSRVLVELADDASGILAVTVDDKNYNASVVNGKASVSIDDLDPGCYVASVSYSGDDNYTGAVGVVDINVPKIVLNLDASVETGICSATFTVNLPDDAVYDIIVIINGKESQEKLPVVIGNLNPGDYAADIVYEGDEKYEAANTTVSFTISKVSVELNESTLNIISSNNPTVSLTLDDDATGNLTVSAGGRNYKATLINGKATVIVDGLAAGNYSAVITYSGDGKYAQASESTNLEVAKVETEINDGNLIISVVEGSTCSTFTLALPGDATGSLTVTVNGKDYSASVVNGSATVIVDDLIPDNYSASVVYSGDAKYAGAGTIVGFEIGKIVLKLDVDVKTSDDNVTFNVNLPEDAAGDIVVKVNGSDYNGLLPIIVSGLGSGNYEAVVVYTGDEKYEAVNRTVRFAISMVDVDLNDTVLNVITPSSTPCISITLKEDAKGNLTVAVGGKTYTAAIVGGKASILIDDLNPGNYSCEVIYSGDDRYGTASREIDIEVLKIKIGLELNATEDYINISLAGDASGSVSVNVGGKTYIAKVVGGIASVKLDGLSPGDYNASVVYSGDDKYLSTASSVFVEIPKISIVLDDSNLIAERSSVSVKLADDATGTLTVAVDGKNYTANVINGRATVSIDDLNPGNYSFDVAYSGDVNYTEAGKIIDISVPKIALKLRASVETGICSATFTLNLPDDADGEVIVTIDGNEHSSALPIVVGNLNPGSYEAVVAYTGDEKYEAANTTVRFTVSKINLELNESNMIVSSQNGTAAVSVDLDGDATGTLTVTVSGQSLTGNVVAGKSTVTVVGLAPGNYSVEVVYSGDGKYTAASKTIGVEVPKLDPEMDLNAASNVINVAAVGDATGIVTVEVCGRTYVENLINGKASIRLDDLAPGDYNATVVYSGDDVYLAAAGIVGVSIPKINVVFDDSNLMVNNSIVTVMLAGDSTGTLTVTAGNKNYTSAIVDGRATVNVDGLAPGKHSLEIVYSGDRNYTSAIKIVDVDVAKIVLNLDAEVETGEGRTIVTSSLPEDAEGTLTVTVDGADYVAAVVNGVANVDLSALMPGNYSAVVVYSGDDRYGSVSKTIDVEIPKLAIEFGDDTLTVGVPDGTTGPIFSISLPSDASGTLTVSVDGRNYTVEVVNGSASVCVDDLAPGDYDVTVVYSGDGRYESVSSDVNVSIPKLSIEFGDDALAVGVPDGTTGPIFSISLPSDASGTLTVSVDGRNYTVEVVNGSASVCVDDLAPGDYDVTVVYSGDGRYGSVSRDVDVIIPKVELELNETALTFDSAGPNIAVDLPGDASGTLTVKVDDANYVVSVVNGKANVNLSALMPGNYSAVVVYSGDDRYESVSRTVDIEILKFENEFNNDTLVVDVEEGSTSPTFSIDLPDDAEGTLTVTINDKNYTVDVVNGSAVIDADDLTPGDYDATVVYSGDDKYSSLSKNLKVIVPKVKFDFNNETLVVESNENSSSFTVDLPDDATGTVTVTVDGRNYTAKLVNGKATVNVMELSSGNHEVTVTYSGDSKYSSVVRSDTLSVNETARSPKKATDILISVSDIHVGDDAVINVESSVGSAEFTLTLNNKNYTLAVENGKAGLSVSGLAAGKYDVVVKFAGNGEYLEAVNSTAFSVLRKTIEVTDDVLPQSDDSTVYSINLPEDASGTLTVNVDGRNYTAELADGKATVKVPELDGGSHDVVVSYSGDAKYSSIVKNMIANIPVIELKGEDIKMRYSSGMYYKVLLTQDGSPLAGKSVELTIDGKTYPVVTDGDGYASLEITLSPKTYEITAVYGNVNTTNIVAVKSIVKAKNVNAKKSAKSIKIKVSLKKVNKKYLKGKKVTLKFNKKKFKAKTNKKGVATFKIKNSVYKKLKVGKKYSYKVSYGKNKVRKTIKFKK